MPCGENIARCVLTLKVAPPRRRFSATLVLLDCGEDTQVALRECGWGLRYSLPAASVTVSL